MATDNRETPPKNLRNGETSTRDDYVGSLLRDHKKMRQLKHQGAPDHELTYKIYDMKASRDEIISWYKSQDPLDEVEGAFILGANMRGDSDFLERLDEFNIIRGAAYQGAAATLVAYTLWPELFNEEAEKWYDNFSQEHRKNNPRIYTENPNYVPTPTEVIFQCLQRRDSDRFRTSELQDLVIAAQLQQHGTEILINNDAVRKGVKEGKMDKDILNFDWQMSTALGAFVVENSEASIDDERLLKLDSAALTVANLFTFMKLSEETGNPEELTKMRRYLLANFVNQLKDIVTLGKNTLTSKRDRIHEYIWVLDTMMYSLLNDSDITVRHSFSFQDRPEIGYPENNRGFDILLSKKGKIKVIQLKSRPSSNGERKYHPGIEVVREEDFKEINLNWLTQKLDSYMEVLLDGKPPEKVLEKYMLKSVVETLRTF